MNGKVIWCGDLARTRNNKPMRGVLVATPSDRDDEGPPCFVRLFGDDAGAVKVGDSLAAEGELETSLGERDGKPSVRLRIMARWSKLIGHAGARQRRDHKRDGHQGPAHDEHASNGPPGPEPPPFDDELPV